MLPNHGQLPEKVAHQLGGEPQGAVKDYLDWIKSDAGQQLLLDKGYPPLRKI